VCPWPFMTSLDSTEGTAAKPPETGKSFAQVLSGSCEIHLTQPPPKVVMGNSVRVKISQVEYETGLAYCSCNLHGRLTLHKGDSSLTTQALKMKHNNLWPNLRNWNLTPLGKGFFEFNFNFVDDMRMIWALGMVNLKPGFLHFYCWSRDFTPQAQAQTHAQIWVRLMHLPQEYLRRKTLYEIASSLGTPLTIDEATQNRRFGIYARVLIDVDLFEKLFESVVVEREGHALSIMVQHEKQPVYCAHCKTLGHNLQNCSKLSSLNNVDVMVPKRAQPATNHPRTQAKSSFASKAPVGIFEGPDLAGKNLASASASTKQHFVVINQTQTQDNNKDMSADIENVEVLSVHEITEKEGVSVDWTEIAV